MRGLPTTTKGHRSVRKLRRAPPASPPLGETERGRAPSGLFSPRRPLQTPSRGRPTPAGLGKGRRRGVLPPLPLGEGWGEGGGRRGPRDLVEARPPSYAKVSPREKIEMRGPLTTTKAHRSVRNLRRAPPASPPLGETERGRAPSGLFSPREKIEMRGPLTTTKAHRSAPLSPSECPAPPPSVIPAKAGIPPSLRPLPPWGRLERGRAPSGLFSPREKIEMRGPLTTTKAHRSAPLSPSECPPPPPSVIPAKAGIPPSLPPLPLWGETERGRAPSGLFSPREKIEMRGPLATTKAHRSAPLSPSECPAPPPSVIPAKAGIHPSRRGVPCGRPLPM